MTIYDRQTLYEEVWKEPVSVVARRYGVSDVAVHKICRRLRIPVPGRGYWAKYRAGGQVMKEPLPRYDGPQRIVSRRGEARGQAAAHSAPGGDLGFLDDDTRRGLLEVCSNITVPAEMTRPHPLIAEAEKRLRRQKPGDNSPPGQVVLRALGISVTRASLERALRIMNTLVKTLERLGHAIIVEEQSSQLVVQINGEKVHVSLAERLKRVDHVLTPLELEKRRKNQYFWTPSHDYLPTGQLTLTIDSLRISRRNWRDDKKRRLEGHLGEFIVALVLAAANERTWREERERERQIMIQEELRRLELEQLRQEESERFRRLELEAMDWRQANLIRDYVKAVEESGKGTEDLSEQTGRDEWVAWARSKADWLDPLIAREDPVLGKRKRNLKR